MGDIGESELPDSWNFPAPKTLRIIITGAGIAGLSAAIALRTSGHDVLVLEKKAEHSEVGAGINVPPNTLRILERWGLADSVAKSVTYLDRISLRRWQDGKELGCSDCHQDACLKRYGWPAGIMHRKDLHKMLLDRAQGLGTRILMDVEANLAEEDFAPKVMVAGSFEVEADLVLAADGVTSKVRSQMLRSLDITSDWMIKLDAAWRVLIPREKLQRNPVGLEILSKREAVRWVGPRWHVFMYPIRDGQLLNIVAIYELSANTEAVTESWTRNGDKQKMLEWFADWDPHVLLPILRDADPELLWEGALNFHRHMPSWYRDHCVLVGDACHAMMPYVGQGAAQAIEDAAALAICLAKASTVPDALKAFEKVRKPRVEAIHDSTIETRRVTHLPDGEEQRQRDVQFAKAARGDLKNPDLLSDRSWQDFMWGTDVMKDICAAMEIVANRNGEKS